MSRLVPEYIRVARKSAVDTTFGFLSSAFDASQKLAKLNTQTVKSILEESQENLVEGLSTRESNVLFFQPDSRTKGAVEKGQAYWIHVRDILAETHGQFATFADTQFKQYLREAQTIVDSIAKTAPARSEAAETAWEFPKNPG